MKTYERKRMQEETLVYYCTRELWSSLNVDSNKKDKYFAIHKHQLSAHFNRVSAR